VEFSRELRNDVLAGDITLSVRLWKRPRVKQGGRYRVAAAPACPRTAVAIVGTNHVAALDDFRQRLWLKRPLSLGW
jgi:hypothetical protein